MGGNAFKQLLPDATFPRMHPTVYHTLKSQVLPIVRSFYAYATVSPEAPEKADFGDLDIVVAGPRDGLTHEEIRTALRATCSIPREDNRTSNFAIPINAFKVVMNAYKRISGASQDANVVVQVDLNVNADAAQWQRTVFWSSYGDLGFFLGLFSQTAGMSFSVYGLKLVEPLLTQPPRTYFLTDSMDAIVAFFGLSMDRWRQGFATQVDLFAWLASSPFIHVLLPRYRSPDYKLAGTERPMRASFINYLRTHEIPAPSGPVSLFATEGNIPEKIVAALEFFGKTEEHATLLYMGRVHRVSKEILNGTNVSAWTGVKGKPIRFLMDEVKVRLGRLPAASAGPALPDSKVEGWQRAVLELNEEGVKLLVVSVKQDMEKDGRLEYDWKAAKSARLWKKQQKQSEEIVTAVAIASA